MWINLISLTCTSIIIQARHLFSPQLQSSGQEPAVVLLSSTQTFHHVADHRRRCHKLPSRIGAMGGTLVRGRASKQQGIHQETGEQVFHGGFSTICSLGYTFCSICYNSTGRRSSPTNPPFRTEKPCPHAQTASPRPAGTMPWKRPRITSRPSTTYARIREAVA